LALKAERRWVFISINYSFFGLGAAPDVSVLSVLGLGAEGGVFGVQAVHALSAANKDKLG